MRAYVVLGLWTVLVTYVAIVQGATRPVEKYLFPGRQPAVTKASSPKLGQPGGKRSTPQRRAADRGVDLRAYDGPGMGARAHADGRNHATW